MIAAAKNRQCSQIYNVRSFDVCWRSTSSNLSHMVHKRRNGASLGVTTPHTLLDSYCSVYTQCHFREASINNPMLPNVCGGWGEITQCKYANYTWHILCGFSVRPNNYHQLEFKRTKVPDTLYKSTSICAKANRSRTRGRQVGILITRTHTNGAPEDRSYVIVA